MGCYVIAVGGTGNKILESVVYGAAADVFRAVGKEDAPLSKIAMLSVDVDSACGNTTRAKRAAEYYENLRAAYAAYPARHRGFHTALQVERWSMNLSRRAASVDAMVENRRRDRLLSRTIFTKTESALEYSEGFRGHPDLGVLFFAELLESLDELRALRQPDEMNDFMDQMLDDVRRGETVKVVLCGSIFGGTGASGIPAIARYLRARFAEHNELFELAAMLMLPYYKVPPSSKNEELEIVVKSSVFLDKARTALQYYGMEGMIRDDEADESGVFDAMYLLGLPPEAFVTTRLYSTGSQSQENDAHMLEWIAMRCIASFFRTGFRGENARNIDCYYYQCHSRYFSWQWFGCDEDRYRTAYGGLLKAAALFLAECYPTLLGCVTGSNRKCARVGYCAPYFTAPGRAGGERARQEALLSSLYHFFSFYANWMIQIAYTLPPTMRPKRDGEELLELCALHYARLCDLDALLWEREAQPREAAARRGDQSALSKEYEEALQTRDLLLKRAGGAVWLETLKAAQDTARERLYRQEAETGAQQDRVHAWRAGNGEPIDPAKLEEEEERLAAMRRVLASMEHKLSRVRQDVRDAVCENVLEAFPAAEETPGDALPPNRLLDAEMAGELYRLLAQYAKPPAQRDAAVFQRACLSLQKGLNRLIVGRVRDQRSAARVMAGLGGGKRLGTGAEAALCSFLSVLLEAVGEEET